MEPHRQDEHVYTSSIADYHYRFEAAKSKYLFYRIPPQDSTHVRQIDRSPEDYYIPRREVKTSLLHIKHLDGLLSELTFPSGRRPPTLNGNIKDHFSTVFCILLCSNLGDRIVDFVQEEDWKDESLATTAKKPGFLTEDEWQEFKKFRRHFCPVSLSNSKRSFDPMAIIPYTKVEYLNEGASARIYKIRLDNEYDQLESQRREFKIGSSRPRTSQSNEQRPDKAYAVKVYFGRNSSQYFENEVKIFEEIKGTKERFYSTGLIEYLGAYKRKDGNEHCTILELADGGTLEDLFERNDPPRTAPEIHDFWKRMFELFEGLAKLHDPSKYRDTKEHKRCIHKDIHPGNIVLVIDLATPFKDKCLQYKYVLADLGHSSMIEVEDSGVEPEARAIHAGRAYIAPEAYPFQYGNPSSLIKVTAAADIFSLGAVFLVAAVWVVHGPNGVKEFHNAREREFRFLQNQRNLRVDGDAPFHTGQQGDIARLEVVDRYLDYGTLRSNIIASDRMTHSILHRVLDSMLQTSTTHRASALGLVGLSERLLAVSNVMLQVDAGLLHILIPGIIKEALDLDLQHPSSREQDERAAQQPFAQNTHLQEHVQAQAVSPNTSPLTPVHSPPPSTAGSFAHDYTDRNDHKRGTIRKRQHDQRNSSFVTVDDVLDYKGWCEGSQTWLNISSFQRRLRQLRQGHRLTDLKHRDIMFLVDDAESMAIHKQSLRETFEAMAYVTHDSDDDGIDLWFTSSEQPVNSKNTSELVDMVRKHEYRGTTDIEMALSRLLTHCRKKCQLEKEKREPGILSMWRGSTPPTEGFSVYVLTDGKWDGGSEAKTPINKWLQDLREEGCPPDKLRVKLNFSFIRFGDDTLGCRRMEQLDDLNTGERDIVDTEDYRGNFWKMMLGGMDKDLDNMDDRNTEASSTAGAD